MVSVALLILAAPPSAGQAQTFAQQMCEYYAKALETAKAGDQALAANDARTAQRQFSAASSQLSKGADQLQRAKGVGSFSDDLKIKCSAGSFTGATLAKAFSTSAKTFEAKAQKAAAAPATVSEKDKARALASIGSTLEQVEKLERDAAAEADPKKGLRNLELCTKTFQWVLDSIEGLRKRTTLTKKDTVPLAKGAQPIDAVVKRSRAGVERSTAALTKARAEVERVEAAAKAQAKADAAKADAAKVAQASNAKPAVGKSSGKSSPKPVADEEAPPPLARTDYVTAATFAAGSCNFGNCAKSGWDSRGNRTSCNFGECLKHGWETVHASGEVSVTSCNFGDCLQHGWETQHPDGEVSRTTCNFSDCSKNGWETDTPAGVAQTSCNFGECFKNGWDTSLPTGGSVRCSCDFEDCLGNGASCD